MLKVLFNQQIVGSLWSEKNRLLFQYDPKWQTLPNAFALSPRLPLQVDAFTNEEPALFFKNLLPEGLIFENILKFKKISSNNLYEQLNILGEDAAGAFSIVNAANLRDRNPHYQDYPLTQLTHDLALMRKGIPLLAQHGELRLSLAGAQNKIAVKYQDNKLSLPVDGAPSTHILKPQIIPSETYPNSVWNEALCLRLAKLIGLHTVNIELLTNPEPILLIERYDRLIHENNISRLHQLDFCQLSGAHEKYQTSGGPSLIDVFTLINLYSAAPLPDRMQTLSWVIFNYLIGNADAHAKNIALLIQNNQMRLAPFYDLLSTEIYPHLTDKMAMAIGGEYRPNWVAERHWQRFAQAVDLNLPMIRKFAVELAQKTQDNLHTAAESLDIPIEHPIVQKIQHIIKKRTNKLAIK